MKFEYDSKKSVANKEKHGIDFEQAKTLWDVPALEIEARTIDEPRYMIIGKIKGRLYSCIYTKRNEAVRIISARRSRKKEEVIYYQYTDPYYFDDEIPMPCIKKQSEETVS